MPVVLGSHLRRSHTILGGGQGKWALWQVCPTTEESLKNALFSVMFDEAGFFHIAHGQYEIYIARSFKLFKTKKNKPKIEKTVAKELSQYVFVNSESRSLC